MLAIMAVLLVIFCVALFKYDQSHNVGTKAYNTLMQHKDAVSAQNTTLLNQNKTLETSNATLATKNTELLNEKSQFCGELGKAKVTDPLCTQ